MAGTLSLPTLVQRVKYDTSGATRAASGIQKSEGHITKSFGGIRKAAGLLTAAISGIAIGKFVKDSVSEAREAGRVSRLTAAVVKSTGGAAKITADQVGELSTKLSNLTGIDDEAIQGGENLLLTFTNVRNEVGKGNDIFNQATGIMADMSAALGQDMKSSAIQLGKALNDPIKGVTALQRVGVSFTQSQKDQIKTLVESGDTLAAQKLILGELGKEFGGAAAAATDPLQKLGVIVKNVEERIGTAMLPTIQKLATFVGNTLVPFLLDVGKALSDGFSGRNVNTSGVLGVVQDIGEGIRGLVDYVRGPLADTFREVWPHIADALGRARDAFVPFAQSIGTFVKAHPEVVLAAVAAALAGFGTAKTVSAIGGVGSAIGAVLPMLASLGAPGLIVAGIAAIVAAFVLLYQNSQAVRDATQSFVDWLTTEFGPQIQEVAQFFSDQFSQMADFVRENMAGIRETIDHVVVAALAFWHQFGDEITAVTLAAFNYVRAVIQGAMQIIRGIILVVTGLINGDWGKAWEGVKRIFDGVWEIIQASLRLTLAQMKAVLTAALGVIRRLWEIAWNAITAVLGNIWGKITRTVGSGVDAVVGFFRSLPGRIAGLAGAIGSAAGAVGLAIARGLVNGVTGLISGGVDFVAAIGRAVKNVLNGIIDRLNSAFDFTLHGPGPLPDLHVNLPDIPHFEKGGTVPGSFGVPQLIQAHGGEVVIGLDEVRAMRRMMGAAPSSRASVPTVAPAAAGGDTVTIGPIYAQHVDENELLAYERRRRLLQRRRTA